MIIFRFIDINRANSDRRTTALNLDDISYYYLENNDGYHEDEAVNKICILFTKHGHRFVMTDADMEGMEKSLDGWGVRFT